MLITTSCTDETDTFNINGTSLQLNVKTAGIETRGLIESATLPDASTIGLTLTDAGGTTYDNISYNNIKATASTGATPQTWTLASDMLLSSTSGTLYGYYPYNSAVTDITQVPVTAGDTDYMYATPVENLNDGNYTASVTMNHALAAIRLNIVRGTYTGIGSVTSVSIKGSNIATSGILNAKTGVLSSQTGTGITITDNTAFTLSTTAKQIDKIIVPVTSSSAAPTFTVNMDGAEYTVTPAAVTFERGSIYEYTLTVDAKDISLADVKVGDWGYNNSGNPVIEAGYKITLVGDLTGIAISTETVLQSRAEADESGDGYKLYIDAVPVYNNRAVKNVTVIDAGSTYWYQSRNDRGVLTIKVSLPLTQDITINFNGCLEYIDLTTADNGVYAVAKNGKGVSYEDADESCIAVALIVNDAPTPQRLMIEKYESYRQKWGYYCWGVELSDIDINGITNYNSVDGSVGISGSFFAGSNIPQISTDYTNWTIGALSDYKGKSNTANISLAYTNYKLEYNESDMCKSLQEFNDGNENQGYNDWYIPACGQLALIFLNGDEINKMLTVIGGTRLLLNNVYNSSSEYNESAFWIIIFSSGEVSGAAKSLSINLVRIVRDIQ